MPLASRQALESNQVQYNIGAVCKCLEWLLFFYFFNDKWPFVCKKFMATPAKSHFSWVYICCHSHFLADLDNRYWLWPSTFCTPVLISQQGLFKFVAPSQLNNQLQFCHWLTVEGLLFLAYFSGIRNENFESGTSRHLDWICTKIVEKWH